MNRALLFLVPAFVFACTNSDPGAEVAASNDSADLVESASFDEIESAFGFTKDPNRTRPEAVLTRGTCYKAMAAGTREWNLRRYTRGAAFFYVGPGDEPGPIACVDVDIDVGAQFPKVVGVAGLGLDVALRFELGKLHWFGPPQIPRDGMEYAGFERGGMLVKPSDLGATPRPNVAAFDGHIRGTLTELWPPGYRGTHAASSAPKIETRLPGVAMLAYRYANEARAMIDVDPIGHFVSLADESVPADDTWRWVARFETARIDYAFHPSAPGAAEGAESLSLFSAKGEALAGCERPVDAAAHDWECWNVHGAAHAWEKAPN
ncbi:MAG: hypothetical protein KIT84_03965 [Labilithrix sp.]|nr:hypothetical protein [Labilithrix sp.]MCW5810141.1 hypothetical protein [Labilithrix sp.]